MSERYLTSFENQTTALGYTSGDTTLVSPQVSLVGADEVVYSKEIPNESRIRFAKDEATGRLYFVIDGVYYDITELVKKSIPVPSTGYGEVDLGLSVKWADRNVGAETPQDNGAYFSWGNVEGVVPETTKKSEDDLIEQCIIIMLGGEGTPEQIEEAKNNPEIMNEINQIIPMLISGEYILISDYSFDADTYATTSGGQYTGSELDAEHDAATVNMGSNWRIPTSAEIVELVEHTDHYYIGLNGEIVDKSELNMSKKIRSICFVKKGENFIYNYNIDVNQRNFIEIPFAGECNGISFDSDGLIIYVWSSSVYENNGEQACILHSYSNGHTSGNYVSRRYNGLSVRGVRA